MPGRGWRTGKEKAPPFAARCKQLRSASTLTVEGRGLQRKRKHRGPGNACLDFEPGSFSAFLWFSLNPHKGASTKSPGCSLSIQHPPQNTSKSLKSFFFYHLPLAVKEEKNEDSFDCDHPRHSNIPKYLPCAWVSGSPGWPWTPHPPASAPGAAMLSSLEWVSWTILIRIPLVLSNVYCIYLFVYVLGGVSHVVPWLVYRVGTLLTYAV